MPSASASGFFGSGAVKLRNPIPGQDFLLGPPHNIYPQLHFALLFNQNKTTPSPLMLDGEEAILYNPKEGTLLRSNGNRIQLAEKNPQFIYDVDQAGNTTPYSFNVNQEWVFMPLNPSSPSFSKRW